MKNLILKSHQEKQTYHSKLQSIFYHINPAIIDNFCNNDQETITELYRTKIESHKKIYQFISAMLDMYFDINWSKYSDRNLKLFILKLIEVITQKYKRLTLKCVELAFENYTGYATMKTYGRIPSIPYVRQILDEYCKIRSQVEKRYFDIAVKTYTNKFDPDKKKKARQEIIYDYEKLAENFNIDVSKREYIEQIPSYWFNALVEEKIINVTNDMIEDAKIEAVKMYRFNLIMKIKFCINDYKKSSIRTRIKLIDQGKYEHDSIKAPIQVITEKILILKSII